MCLKILPCWTCAIHWCACVIPCRLIEHDFFVSCAGTYASGELYVVKEVDEDNHVRYEFTDKEGRIVLTRSINGNEGMDDTYYIYDIFGNLRVVLPPMCSANFFYSGSLTDSASVLSDYAFLYKYDTRNRCIGKKQPGCEWVELVYDRCDRLIFTQNGKERANNEWAFIWKICQGGLC